MEKRQLLHLLQHYSGTSSQEAADVISLVNEYPYSQVLHALSARVSKDHNLENQQSLLQAAAIYSTDRTVLKEIMSGTYQASVVKEKSKSEVTVVQVNNIQATLDAVDYADLVIQDLEKLNTLKHNFEALAADLGYDTTEQKKKPPVRTKKHTDAIASDPLIEDIKTSKKKNRT